MSIEKKKSCNEKEAYVCGEFLPMREHYLGMLLDEEFLMMPRVRKAKEIGVSVGLIKKWEEEVDWGKIAQKYRERYAKHYPEIDMALIKKAKDGNEKAIELFYQRFENWSMRSGIDITVKGEEYGPGYLDKLIEERKKVLEAEVVEG